MKVIMIFIDGLGLGEKKADKNPLVMYPMSFMQDIFKGPLTMELGTSINNRACLIPTDANLGLGGLPQSATGQTTIFTGINASQLMRSHIHAFPGPRLAKVIEEHGIMGQLKKKGYTITSANAYTPDYMDLVARRKRRHSATTLTILHAGQPLREIERLQVAEAVYQDITNKMLTELGYTVPLITPTEAGENLVAIARQHHFTIFEYFQTDRCGHKRDWIKAQEIVNTLNEFIYSVYDNMDTDMTLFITSDHGNFEDFSVKTHTRNFVPTLILGKSCNMVALKIRTLADITPAIIELLERNGIYD